MHHSIEIAVKWNVKHTYHHCKNKKRIHSEELKEQMKECVVKEDITFLSFFFWFGWHALNAKVRRRSTEQTILVSGGLERCRVNLLLQEGWRQKTQRQKREKQEESERGRDFQRGCKLLVFSLVETTYTISLYYVFIFYSIVLFFSRMMWYHNSSPYHKEVNLFTQENPTIKNVILFWFIFLCLNNRPLWLSREIRISKINVFISLTKSLLKWYVFSPQ